MENAKPLPVPVNELSKTLSINTVSFVGPNNYEIKDKLMQEASPSIQEDITITVYNIDTDECINTDTKKLH